MKKTKEAQAWTGEPVQASTWPKPKKTVKKKLTPMEFRKKYGSKCITTKDGKTYHSMSKSFPGIRVKKPKKRRSVKTSMPLLKKNLQTVFNAFIRARDRNKPCVSCENGKPETAGHYVAQGKSSFLRYDERNVNGQCVSCNKHNRGNLIPYGIELDKRWGEGTAKLLWSQRNTGWKWTRQALEEKMVYYTTKLKEIKS